LNIEYFDQDNPFAFQKLRIAVDIGSLIVNIPFNQENVQSDPWETNPDCQIL